MAIFTNALKRSDLPTGDIGWREFSIFALTFDPRVDLPSEDDMAQMDELDPKEAHTIRALRARLYNWQRIWHHHNYERPPPEFYADVRQVIGWIEKHLRADSSEQNSLILAKRGAMIVANSEEVILTKDLKKSHLPTGEIGWREFSNFALTFDPRLDSLSEEEMAQMSERHPKDTHTLRSLRARLYNWQRIRNNQYNDDPPPEFYRKVEEVVGWMAARLP